MKKKKINNSTNYLFVFSCCILLIMLIIFSNGIIYKGTRANDVVTYKITFDTNDNGSVISSYELYTVNGSSYLYTSDDITEHGLIPIPEKESYEFAGWWTAIDGGELVIYPSGDIVDGNVTNYVNNGKWNMVDDITLYAHYLKNVYRVNFDCTENGGYTNNVYMVYSLGEEINLSKVCKKSDNLSNNLTINATSWTFVGFNTDKDATSGIDSYVVGNNDNYLYAIYRKEAKTLVANFDNNGASISSNIPKSCVLPAVYNTDIQDISCTVTPPTITPNNGYVAIGWSTNKNSKVSDSNYDINTNKLTLYSNAMVESSQFDPEDTTNNSGIWYAITSAIKYKVVFNAGDGNINGKDEFYVKNNDNKLYVSNDSDTLGVMPIAYKIGYSFDGWYTSNDDMVIDRFGHIINGTITDYLLDGNWNVSDNVTLYAHYNMADELNNNAFTLEFNNNNFVIDNDNKILYQIPIGVDSSWLFNLVLSEASLDILDSNNNVLLENGILKTGYKLRAIINDVAIYYTLSVKGDVIGTGELSRNNAKMIAKHIIDKNVIAGNEYLLAADYDNDGYIKMNDVIKMLIDMRRD